MRRTQIALGASGLWLAAGGVAVVGFYWLGPNGVAFGIALLAFALALTGSGLIGNWADRKAARELLALARTVGAGLPERAGDPVSLERIVGALAHRLDRASQIRSAYGHSGHLGLVATLGGEILAVSQGLNDLVPQARVGANIDVIFGAGQWYEGGGSAAETALELAGKRYLASRRWLGAARMLIELNLDGQVLADADLDAFVDAIWDGRTAFRFDPGAVARAPQLERLNGCLEIFDSGMKAMERLAAGDPIEARILASNAGFGPSMRVLHDAVWDLAADRDAELEACEALEEKIGRVGEAIERYRAQTSELMALANEARAGAGRAGRALEAGRTMAKTATENGQRAHTLANDAAAAARRTLLAVASVDAASGEIDRMVAAIEDVSFRTSLLALDGVVEASRVGDRGAGFAELADEVRLLADATTRGAREVRAMVARSRAQVGAGSSEAGQLQKIVTGLAVNLLNLSDETAMIAGALEEGEGALDHLSLTFKGMDNSASARVPTLGHSVRAG